MNIFTYMNCYERFCIFNQHLILYDACKIDFNRAPSMCATCQKKLVDYYIYKYKHLAAQPQDYIIMNDESLNQIADYIVEKRALEFTNIRARRQRKSPINYDINLDTDNCRNQERYKLIRKKGFMRSGGTISEPLEITKTNLFNDEAPLGIF